MPKPLVAILMGSKSDWGVMEEASRMLDKLKFLMKRVHYLRIVRLMLYLNILNQPKSVAQK